MLAVMGRSLTTHCVEAPFFSFRGLFLPTSFFKAIHNAVPVKEAQNQGDTLRRQSREATGDGGWFGRVREEIAYLSIDVGIARVATGAARGRDRASSLTNSAACGDHRPPTSMPSTTRRHFVPTGAQGLHSTTTARVAAAFGSAHHALRSRVCGRAVGPGM